VLDFIDANQRSGGTRRQATKAAPRSLSRPVAGPTPV
jgi:hypothetical protein